MVITGDSRSLDYSANSNIFYTHRVPSTHMENTYPSHAQRSYYGNHTLYHAGTWDSLGT